MAYYAAQVKMTKTGYEAKCEEHGVIGTWDDHDDALDEAAAHDTSHGYDGEGDYED
jgi:hypothetical protein